MKISSYDIFDTALIRKCGYGYNIFFLLAQELYPNSEIKREAFYSWRLRAEMVAEKQKNFPNLNDIYVSLSHDIFCEYSKEDIINKELEIERKNLVGNPFIRKRIAEQRKSGWKIVFISDMYLNTLFLKDILKEQGLFEEGDEIFVSSDFSASKANGKLFDIVYQKYSPQKWIHTGDNIHSDVNVPQKKNIKTNHYVFDYTDVEKEILRQKHESNNYNYYAIVMGLCRYARIIHSNGINPNFSADFVAPIYISFLLDILDISIKEGINRLYFWARDGWILFELAKLLFRDKVDIRYFFASRKSLYLPSLLNFNFDEISAYFGQDKKNISPKRIIEYFDLSDVIPVNTFADIDEFKKYIQRNEIKTLVNDKIESKLKLLADYIQQEGMDDKNINYAFVDIGWKGSGLYALNKLQKRFGLRPSICFYWGTLKRCRGDFPIVYNTHVFDKLLPNYFINLIEDFFSANPQLSTIGYRKNTDNRVEPIFDESSSLHNKDIAMLNLEVATSVIKELLNFNLQNIVVAVFSEIEDSLIQIIKEEPYLIDLKNITEANLSKNEGANSQAFIRKINLFESLKYIMGGTLDMQWNDASVCLTYPSLSKCILHLHFRNRNRLHKFKNIVKKLFKL